MYLYNPNIKKWFALGYKTNILFKKYHEDRKIPSFPQSVLLLLEYWSKLPQLYFGNIVVLEIVLTEEADWNFLFCTRQIFPFKHVSVANSIGNIKTEALTPNSPVHSASCPWLCSYQIHCKTQGQKLCPSLGVEQGLQTASIGYHALQVGNHFTWAAPDFPGTGCSVPQAKTWYGDTVLQAGQCFVLFLFSLARLNLVTKPVILMSCSRFYTFLFPSDH